MGHYRSSRTDCRFRQRPAGVFEGSSGPAAQKRDHSHRAHRKPVRPSVPVGSWLLPCRAFPGLGRAFPVAALCRPGHPVPAAAGAGENRSH